MEAEQELVVASDGGCFFYFIFKKCLPSVFGALGKVFAECPTKTLGKTTFAVKPFAECRLSSVTLGKRFTECFGGLALGKAPVSRSILKIKIVSLGICFSECDE